MLDIYQSTNVYFKEEKRKDNNLYIQLCNWFPQIENRFSQIINSYPQITLFVPSIEASILLDCTSFPQITQSILSDCNRFLRIGIIIRFLDFNFQQFKLSKPREWLTTQKNGLSNSREQIAIPENGLSYSRERIINQWERITNT